MWISVEKPLHTSLLFDIIFVFNSKNNKQQVKVIHKLWITCGYKLTPWLINLLTFMWIRFISMLICYIL